jgi:hypothetical protein
MEHRILHCGSNITNYNLCIDHRVVGFTRRMGATGDTIYLVVKPKKEALCGARAKLGQLTDTKPWPDAERYVQCFTITDIEFCEPFPIKKLKEYGGQGWTGKYLQQPSAIKEDAAVQFLEEQFALHPLVDMVRFVDEQDEDAADPPDVNSDIDTSVLGASNNDGVIKIMGTFQIVPFLNETDQNQGLERLVTDNFYNLFTQFPEDKTVLIAENRMFTSVGIKDENDTSVSGISTVPDGLLLVYNKEQSEPIQVNLIEYECYGEGKVKPVDKFNYLNGHIIPQLMRFASTFSIITDNQIRSQTVDRWVRRIVDYVYKDTHVRDRVYYYIHQGDDLPAIL